MKIRPVRYSPVSRYETEMPTFPFFQLSDVYGKMSSSTTKMRPAAAKNAVRKPNPFAAEDPLRTKIAISRTSNETSAIST